MSKLHKKIIQPYSTLIEQTAGQMAGVFFDAARSSGLTVIQLQGQKINLLKYRNNPHKFARAHLEKFIPAAVHSLIEILSKPETPDSFKDTIYQAIQERTNDEQLGEMGKMAGLPEFEQTVLYKPDNEKPKPVIVNTVKPDFNFDNKRN